MVGLGKYQQPRETKVNDARPIQCLNNQYINCVETEMINVLHAPLEIINSYILSSGK